jgi:hypothetical protein
VTGTLSNVAFYSLSNQVQALSNNTSTLSTQASWTSNLAVSSCNSVISFPNDAYAKISSNTSSITWTSISLVSLSPLTLGQYCSNLATYGCNFAVAAQATANFCSNLIPTFMTSNVFYPLWAYDSNTATWLSNQLATLSTTANFTLFSNYVSPLATFGCDAGVWSSNGLNTYSNYILTTFVYSNPLYLYVNAQCNPTWSNTTSLSTLSNSFAAWSNL